MTVMNEGELIIFAAILYVRARCFAGELTDEITVTSGHTHAPKPEDALSKRLEQRMKRRATANPQEPPARIIRDELIGESDRVVVNLPQRESLRRTLNRRMAAIHPRNP